MNQLPQPTRRNLLDWGCQGLGATALASLLHTDGVLAASDSSPTTTHLNHAPRAKRAIHICLVGGMSHLDSFDYKEHLVRLHGKTLKTDEQPDIFFGRVGLLRQSDWVFRRHGESGLWVSDMFPPHRGCCRRTDRRPVDGF